MYWYELIHRPVGIETVPKGFAAMEETHCNRNGFMFGKVAYAFPLSQEDRRNFNLEPVFKLGMLEVGMITQETLNNLGIRMTLDVVHYLIENKLVKVMKHGEWEYVDYIHLEVMAKEQKEEMRSIYKMLRKIKKIKDNA